ncbi:MAG: hypothetical protein U1A22_08550 [Xanthomonadaceae bacterium]|nr:hypothetical protein [Xanthomonadaceae bacterium]
MSRVFAKRLFFIASRLLLAVSLVFSTGVWASLAAASGPALCHHTMDAELDQVAPAGHEAGHEESQTHVSSGMSCCDGSDPSTCLTGAELCPGNCEALCSASSWQVALTPSLMSPAPTGRSVPVSAANLENPSPSLPRALRPPISA